ncbi:SAE2-domain-containing protein [Xylariaceae sp. FL0804]|nr:SAE2-domain-containing protein [Xylariaceae sp. FL0804]
MESWFRDVGRPALAEALTGICDRIESDFDDASRASARENERLAAELQAQKHDASRADSLERENLALKAEVESLKGALRSDAQPKDPSESSERARESRVPLANRSADQVSSPRQSDDPAQVDIGNIKLPELKAAYIRAETKYSKLYDKYLELKDTLTESKNLLRERTAAYHRWVSHANQLKEQSETRSRRIKKLEARLGEAAQGSLNLSFVSDTSEGNQAAAPAPTAAKQSTPEVDRLDPVRSNSILRDAPPMGSTAISTGADHGPPPPAIEQVPGPEVDAQNRRSCMENEIIGPDECEIDTESETPCLPPLPQDCELLTQSTIVKEEPSSDTPIVVSERCLRKRKHSGDENGHPPSLTRIKIESNVQPLATAERRRFVPQESMDFDAEASRVHTPKKHNRWLPTHEDDSSSSPNPLLYREDDNHHLRRPRRRAPAKTEQHGTRASLNYETLPNAHRGEYRRQHTSALAPLDPNSIPQQGLQASRRFEPNKSSALPPGLASLAEDCDQENIPVTTSTPKMRPGGVLSGLLNSPSSEHEPISLSSSRRAKRRGEFPSGKDNPKELSKTRQVPKGSGVSGHSRTLGIHKQKDKADGVGRRGLRHRPVSELGLDDFKVNPNVNDGYNYAYTDVVRSRDERAGLQGCISENCCGPKVRALARVELDMTGPVDIQVFLESHLGDECYKLATMSKQEKENMWLAARMREIANKSGRHRHRYQRLSTPPGFWRTDFPSTQEVEEDREAAARMVREAVEERHREALQPGGRWLFQDE